MTMFALDFLNNLVTENPKDFVTLEMMRDFYDEMDSMPEWVDRFIECIDSTLHALQHESHRQLYDIGDHNACGQLLQLTFLAVGCRQRIVEKHAIKSEKSIDNTTN